MSHKCNCYCIHYHVYEYSFDRGGECYHYQKTIKEIKERYPDIYKECPIYKTLKEVDEELKI